MTGSKIFQKGFFFLILFVLVLIPIEGRTEVDGSNAQYPEWMASDAAIDCTGPNDGTYDWYEPEFNDSSWQIITLPLTNDIPGGHDRFYRTEFTKPASGNVYLNLAADDGIWVYINGILVDGTGEVACHERGCIAKHSEFIPWDCSLYNPSWSPLDITSMLSTGTNTIAVHVSNLDEAGSASYFWLSLDVDDLQFNLPVNYNSRNDSQIIRQYYYDALQKNLISVFDHSTAGDDLLQPFVGSLFNNPSGKSDCKLGLNCYDGNLAYGFGTDEPFLRAVYPVAAGDIVSAKSGCQGGEYGCRVCISHGSTGYSTLYANLQSGSLVTSGSVDESDKIGDMDTGDGSTTHEMMLVTFYDPDEACKSGKEIDPAGWAFAGTVDPRLTATGNQSIHTWYYPFVSNTIYDPGVANSLVWQQPKAQDYENTKINFPTDAYTETLRATIAAAPAPTYPYPLADTLNTFYLHAIDESGDPVYELNNPFEIWIDYNDTPPDEVWADTLDIYQFDTATEEWLPLTATISGTEYITSTSTIAPFALLGERKFTMISDTVGSGSVLADPVGPYHYNDVVTITAQADPKWAFSSWSGDTTGSTNTKQITIDSNKEITATFIQVLFDVDVTVVGDGSVDIDPIGQLSYGEQVTLTATPDPGWYLSAWSGDHTGNDNPAVITVESDLEITATFAQYGSITIQKETDPGGGTGFSFSGDLGSFNLDDDGSRTFTSLEAGDYEITENLTAAWQMDGSPVCTGGDSTPIVNGVRVSLEPAEEITCTFTNNRRGTITIYNDTNPDLGTWFEYGGDFGSFSLKNGLSQSYENLEMGTYVITQNAETIWELDQISCTGGSTTPIANGISIGIQPGSEVSCTFENILANGIYLPLMINGN